MRPKYRPKPQTKRMKRAKGGSMKKPRQMKLAGGIASGVRVLKRAIGKPPKKRPMPRPKREED